MPAEQTACGWAGAREPRVTATGQACPMCCGGLVPLRGQWRCTRCGFLLCVGCEPDDPAASVDEGQS